MFSITNLSLKNLKRNIFSTIATIFGTSLGIALMATLFSASSGVEAQYKNSISKLSHNLTVSKKTNSAVVSGVVGSTEPIPGEYEEKIKNLKGVKSTSPRIIAQIDSQVLDFGFEGGVWFAGVDKEKDNAQEGATKNLFEGRVFEDSSEVIIGKEVLNLIRSNQKEIQIGDKLDLPVNSGEFKEVEIVGFYQVNDLLSDNKIYGNLELLREITGYSQNEVRSFEVRIDPDFEVEKTANLIQEEFRGRDPEVETTFLKKELESINETNQIVYRFINIVGTVSAVVGGLTIMIVSLLSVMGRKKEFGVLKAVGWKNIHIFILVISESLILSIFGTGFGLLISYFANQLINYYLASNIAVLNLNVSLYVIGFGFIMGLFGGVFPAIQAVKVLPIRALRND